jgi:hypothetical protein
LAEGDALSLSVASGKADYERLVEWNVPDERGADGRRTDQTAVADQNSAWDVVKFANPLPFAMTTAPAIFIREGKFLGQQTSHWVAPGNNSTMRITKALSVRTLCREQESQTDERQSVWVGARRYRQISVKGELTVINSRSVDTKLIINRGISGELVSADDNPKNTLATEGIWSVNRRNGLQWELTLTPGAKKVLKYAYNVMVAE